MSFPDEKLEISFHRFSKPIAKADFPVSTLLIVSTNLLGTANTRNDGPRRPQEDASQDPSPRLSTSM
jgi:hypothetical protein